MATNNSAGGVSGNASLCACSQETKVYESLKPAKQGGSSDELLAFVI